MSGVTIIAGASSGIGREVALQLAAPGETLHLIGRDPERTEATAAQCREAGAAAHGQVLDVTDFEAVEQWHRDLIGGGASVEAFYHCAARSTFGEISDHSLEDLTWVYHTNLLSAAQWVSLVYPAMAKRRRGTIVLLSSLSAYSGFPMVTPYAASKQGLLAFGRSIGAEAAQDGVGVHVACPGFVKTRIFESGRYRDCTHETVMKCVKSLGFPFISSEKAARLLIAGVRKEKGLIVFPFYAKFMGLLGFRFPGFVNLFHRKIVRTLRRSQHKESSPHG